MVAPAPGRLAYVQTNLKRSSRTLMMVHRQSVGHGCTQEYIMDAGDRYRLLPLRRRGKRVYRYAHLLCADSATCYPVYLIGHRFG